MVRFTLLYLIVRGGTSTYYNEKPITRNRRAISQTKAETAKTRETSILIGHAFQLALRPGSPCNRKLAKKTAKGSQSKYDLRWEPSSALEIPMEKK
ncbi:hypothetical protein BN1002_04620 [Bacillus sp. B-jedd]|nr:hypothetical protein BN1002_04620 [Bacillus sp. B-jedd]